MDRLHRSPAWLLDVEAADLRSCPSCHGLIEMRMRTCPSCGRWLGRGSIGLWRTLVLSGCVVTTLAFFLPWLQGMGPAAGQAFSGYELAQIAARLAVQGGQRPTAAASIALYLVPLAGLAALTILIAARPLHLDWSIAGRVIVGLAAIPLQISLLAMIFTLGLLGDNHLAGWPQGGLIASVLGSLVVIGGGIGLGGHGRCFAPRLRALDLRQ